MNFNEFVIYKKPTIDEDYSGNNKKGKQKKNITKASPKKGDKESEDIGYLLSQFDGYDKELIEDIYEQSNKDLEKAYSILKQQQAPIVKEECKAPVPSTSSSSTKFKPQENGFELTKESLDSFKNSLTPTPNGNPYGVTPGDDGDMNYFGEEGTDFETLMEELTLIMEFAKENQELSQCDFDDIASMCEENLVDFWLQEEQSKTAEEEENEKLLNDKIFKECQLYIEQELLKERKSARFDVNGSEFPSLNKANPSSSIYDDRITRYERILGKPQTRSRKPNHWDNPNDNHGIHKVSKVGSARDIIQLVKQFPSMALSDLKTIYSNYDENYEITKNYLMNTYKIYYQQPTVAPKKKVEKPAIRRKLVVMDTTINRDADVEEILKTTSYRELRESVIGFNRIRAVLQRTSQQAKAFNKFTQAHGIENLAKDRMNMYNKYSKASRVYLLRQSRQNNELKMIDLHGLFLDEAKEVLVDQINFIKNCDISQWKFNKVEKGGKTYLKFTIITGKGIHSKGAPVLFPGISEWFKQKGYSFDAEKSEGKLILYVPI
jgi:DNA-nicking Smr family endonuclease